MLNSQNVIIVTILNILGSFNLICNKLTIRINLCIFLELSTARFVVHVKEGLWFAAQPWCEHALASSTVP